MTAVAIPMTRRADSKVLLLLAAANPLVVAASSVSARSNLGTDEKDGKPWYGRRRIDCSREGAAMTVKVTAAKFVETERR